MSKGKQLVASLVLGISAASAVFVGWQQEEGLTLTPVIPVKGDVPTIGHGSTKYEDGTRVKMTDPAITKERARDLALNLMRADADRFAKTLPDDLMLHPVEFKEYLDWVGQYGIGNWMKPKSPRTWLVAGDHVGACKALLNWRFVKEYDCSTLIDGKPNKQCYGVWTRQLKRHDACMAVQA